MEEGISSDPPSLEQFAFIMTLSSVLYFSVPQLLPLQSRINFTAESAQLVLLGFYEVLMIKIMCKVRSSLPSRRLGGLCLG